MLRSLPRRKRLVVITAAFASLFVLLVAVFIWVLVKPEKPYRPGEDIEGLTADLARSIPPDYPRITFVDVTREAGIDFQHFSGLRSTQLPEDMGSGAAWGDYDNDGWPDLFVVNQVGPLTMTAEEVGSSEAHCALYHNNGNGTFIEVSEWAGVDYRGWGMAAAWGDYDNDGWIDLFVSSYGENVFFQNNGDGTFTDVTAKTGLGGYKGFWAGASWADFNRDGFIDLYVTGYVKYTHKDDKKVSKQYDVEVPTSINPSSFEPERNLLYRNNGNGTFTEVAEKAGVLDLQGRSLSAVWCDFDEDGWADLYVANDVSDNVFFRNLGNETFEEISHAAWIADYRGAMGLAVGDWDLDSDTDMFITHWIAQENALYNNQRAQLAVYGNAGQNAVRFIDEADRRGLGQIALDYIGFGTFFFDYDNDGDLDLFVANGSTFQEKEDPTLLIAMEDQLFWNRGADDGFYEVSAVSGAYFKSKFVGRGAAFADYDNDGDVDIFIANNGGPAVLLRNDGGNQNNWLQVSLRGAQSNSQGVGATIRLVVGGNVLIRQVGAQSSYCSQNSLIEHFGLGSRTFADTLEVNWPSGIQQRSYDIPANQTIRLQEGEEIQQ
ncbi:MAG: CRTAC1 family protein [bacterium]